MKARRREIHHRNAESAEGKRGKTHTWYAACEKEKAGPKACPYSSAKNR
jgi:hypothetical protein